MNDETTSNDNAATATVTPAKRILVHTRNEEDRKVLSENFDLSKLGKPSYISGLTAEARMSLVKAAAAGIEIVSTGIPTDLLAEIGGEVTLVRAWSKQKEDGTRSSGSIPPCGYFAGKIRNPEAFAELKAHPAFAKAFNAEDTTDEEGAEIPGF